MFFFFVFFFGGWGGGGWFFTIFTKEDNLRDNLFASLAHKNLSKGVNSYRKEFAP